MKKIIASGLLLIAFAGAALAGARHAPVISSIPDTTVGVLCRDNLGQYVSCTPGAGGNLTCGATCGAGAACLSIDGANHGRCHVPGSREP